MKNKPSKEKSANAERPNEEYPVVTVHEDYIETRWKCADPDEEICEKDDFPLGKTMFNPAENLLKAGHRIVYTSDDHPGGVVAEYPDGRRELVGVDDDGKEYFIRKIPPFTGSRYRTYGD